MLCKTSTTHSNIRQFIDIRIMSYIFKGLIRLEREKEISEKLARIEAIKTKTFSTVTQTDKSHSNFEVKCAKTSWWWRAACVQTNIIYKTQHTTPVQNKISSYFITNQSPGLLLSEIRNRNRLYLYDYFIINA